MLCPQPVKTKYFHFDHNKYACFISFILSEVFCNFFIEFACCTVETIFHPNYGYIIVINSIDRGNWSTKIIPPNIYKLDHIRLFQYIFAMETSETHNPYWLHRYMFFHLTYYSLQAPIVLVLSTEAVSYGSSIIFPTIT